VLAAIKTDVRLQAIPVVVLTTSKAMEDVRQAYRLQANCYVTKPMDFLQFAEAIRATIHFWCALATLP
jgi:two-component system response regulator